MRDDDVRTRTRRKVGLETASLAVPVASAFFFAAVFVAGWSQQVASALGLGVAAVLVAFWLQHRRRFPADISRPAPDDGGGASKDDDDARWDWFTLLLLGVSLVVVVVVGVVARFVVPLLVIVLFAVGAQAAPGAALVAIGCTLAVSFVLEFAIVLPLSKAWDLAIDEEPRSREDFCPRPDDAG